MPEAEAPKQEAVFPDSHEIAFRAHDIAFRNLVYWQKIGTTPAHIEYLAAGLDKLHQKIEDKV